MRPQCLAIIALVLSSCTSIPETPSTPMRSETVRLEPTGELSLRAGDYVETSGFVFVIGFEEDAQDLSTPDAVYWSIGFRNYCRDRPSWVRSIVKGPSGQIWGGYPAFVPPGPDHPQHWSSGSSGSEEYGGPATPGILEAITQGGRFILAVEDDEGQLWNAVTIDTLTPEARNRLFAAQPSSAPREESKLVVVPAPEAAANRSPRACP